MGQTFFLLKKTDFLLFIKTFARQLDAKSGPIWTVLPEFIWTPNEEKFKKMPTAQKGHLFLLQRNLPTPNNCHFWDRIYSKVKRKYSVANFFYHQVYFSGPFKIGNHQK